MTVATGLLDHARRAPHRVAVVLGSEHRSYQALARAVDASAAALRGCVGDAPARVGLLMSPGATFLEGFLGAARAGMTAMVLQTGWSDRELALAVASGTPALSITTPSAANRLRRSGSHAVVVGPDGLAAALRAQLPAARVEPAPLDLEVGDRRPFYIGFTSGTTGRPKGFVRDHRSWLRSFEVSSEVFGTAAGDHVLAPGPLEHSLFLYAAVHALTAGATVHLQPRFSARASLRTLATQPIDQLYTVPAMLDALVRAAGDRPVPLPHVRSIICSGARWPSPLDERLRVLFPAATTFDFYGASELSFVSVRRGDEGGPTSVGHPFPGVEVVVRRDDGTTAAVGEQGRLWVRSDLLFTGYLDEADGDGRDADGWVTVGDVASLDADGRIHLLGREGTMLICGGLNVYPEEIEPILLEIPEVAEVAVVGLPHPRWGDQLCAVLSWEDGRRAPRGRLRAHGRAHLARGKRPQRWLAVDRLPRTPAGKIARAALTAGLCDGSVVAEEVA